VKFRSSIRIESCFEGPEISMQFKKILVFLTVVMIFDELYPIQQTNWTVAATSMRVEVYGGLSVLRRGTERVLLALFWYHSGSMYEKLTRKRSLKSCLILGLMLRLLAGCQWVKPKEENDEGVGFVTP